MIRKEGKVYDAVVEAFKERGLDTMGIEVYTTGRGFYHLILLNGEVIGEYSHNHRHKELLLYSDIVKESG